MRDAGLDSRCASPCACGGGEEIERVGESQGNALGQSLRVMNVRLMSALTSAAKSIPFAAAAASNSARDLAVSRWRATHDTRAKISMGDLPMVLIGATRHVAAIMSVCGVGVSVFNDPTEKIRARTAQEKKKNFPDQTAENKIEDEIEMRPRVRACIRTREDDACGAKSGEHDVEF